MSTVRKLSIQGTGQYVVPEPLEIDLILGTGQSNMWGTNPGLPGVTTGAIYWDTDSTTPTSVKSTFWHAAHGTGVHLSHGQDRSMIQSLLDNGYSGRLAVMNVSFGSSIATDWLPGAAEFDTIKADIQAGISLLADQYPLNTRFRIRPLRNQGQSDARVNSLSYQEQWADFYAQWLEQLQIMVAESLSAEHEWLPSVIVGMSPDQTASFFMDPPVIIGQQQLAAGDADHFIDGAGYGYEPDFVHMLGWPDTTGYVQLGYDTGSRIAFLDSIGQ